MRRHAAGVARDSSAVSRREPAHDADLGPTSEVPWNPSHPIAAREPWERALLLPERIATLVAPLVPLKIFALPFDVLDSHEVLLWHKRNEPDPGHAWLRTLIIEVAREL